MNSKCNEVGGLQYWLKAIAIRLEALVEFLLSPASPVLPPPSPHDRSNATCPAPEAQWCSWGLR